MSDLLEMARGDLDAARGHLIAALIDAGVVCASGLAEAIDDLIAAHVRLSEAKREE